MAFKKILRHHIESYPKHTLVDLYKMIYQSECGGGHIIVDLDQHLHFLIQELKLSKDKPLKEFEKLDEKVYRLYLDGLYDKIDPKTIERMVIKSSNDLKCDFSYIQDKLEMLFELKPEAETAKFISYVTNLKYPIYSHSEVYREAYEPHYRIVSKDLAFYLDIFKKIDQIQKEKKNPVIAIDGMTTSGKTYLAKLIQSIYPADIVSVDDFFLQEDQKTEDRLNEIGGNLDYERFQSDVLDKLDNDSFSYKPYDCQSKAFNEPKKIKRNQMTIIEGSYSLRVPFRRYYDLAIYLSLDPEIQQERLTIRNKHMIDQFMKLWVPKENLYREKEETDLYADLLFDTTGLFDLKK